MKRYIVYYGIRNIKEEGGIEFLKPRVNRHYLRCVVSKNDFPGYAPESAGILLGPPSSELIPLRVTMRYRDYNKSYEPVFSRKKLEELANAISEESPFEDGDEVITWDSGVDSCYGLNGVHTPPRKVIITFLCYPLNKEDLEYFRDKLIAGG